MTLASLGLGAAPLGNLYAPVSDAAAFATLREAGAHGYVEIDTAPLYGAGLSERRIGEALAGDPGRWTISTKVGRRLAPARPEPRDGFQSQEPYAAMFDYTADGVRQTLHASLERLRVDRVDTVYVHDLGVRTHGADHPRQLDQALAEAFPALARLKAEGLVARVGLGVNEVAICLELLGRTRLDRILLAGRHTLLDWTAWRLGLFQACADHGVELVLAGVFNSGLLAGGGTFDYAAAPAPLADRARTIEAVCARHGVPLGAAALRFAQAAPGVRVVLVGARAPEEVTAQAQWARMQIPADLWSDLKSEGLLPVDAPVP